jgi:hypothetical protein
MGGEGSLEGLERSEKVNFNNLSYCVICLRKRN